jgi:hypothetical protein
MAADPQPFFTNSSNVMAIMMLPSSKILIWIALTTFVTAQQGLPCIHGEREAYSANNPKCGDNFWCKPSDNPSPGESSMGMRGTCDEFPPSCTPGGGKRVQCGINGRCSERGHCELAIPDTTECKPSRVDVCGPGSRGCGQILAMCNRCHECVPTPDWLIDKSRGKPCEDTHFFPCPWGQRCVDRYCVER